MTRRDVDLVWGAVLTRFISTVSGRMGQAFLSVGRVQTPTLALIVDKEKERLAFRPETFWEVAAELLKDKQKFLAEHKRAKGQAEADRLASLKGPAKIMSLKEQEREKTPPTPFNTTDYLREATRLGLSAPQAMLIAESLYMNGFISYPRTDNTVYPASTDFRDILEKLSNNSELGKHASELLKQKRLVPTRGKKESKDHPPIHPTDNVEKGKLKPIEWKIYELICRRFFATLAGNSKEAVSDVVFDIDGEEFVSKGIKVLEPGWRRYYPYSKLKENILPKLSEGDEVAVEKIESEQKETTPPNRFGHGSLIKKMEDLNLGTKCLSGECEIIQPNGQGIKLANLWTKSKKAWMEGDTEIRKLNTPTTVSLNENLCNVHFKTPKLISRRKLKLHEKLLRIKTKVGQIEVTSEHPVYILENDTIVLKEAKDLGKGSKLISIVTKNDLGGILVDRIWFTERGYRVKNEMYISRFLNSKSGIKVDKIPLRWSSDLAWLLGYFYGDGSYSSPRYTGSHQMCFTTTEEKALGLLKDRIKRVFGIEPKAYQIKGSVYKVQCNALVATLLVSIFPAIADKQRIDIPMEFVGDFLRGFFDADGNVHLRNKGEVIISGKRVTAHGVPRVKITLAKEDLILWIKELLEKVGIIAPVHEGRAKLREKYFKCFTIRIGGRDNVDRFAWKVGFDIPHKRATLYEGLKSTSPQYERLKVGYDIVLVLRKNSLDSLELRKITNHSKHRIKHALKRLVGMGILKRKRLSPWGKQPNRALYECIDRDYYLHALRSGFAHISNDLYETKVENIEEVKTKKEEFVYDISVEPASPNFITNGNILVHNSTRPAILQKLVERGYVSKGRVLIPSSTAFRVTDVLEKYADLVTKPDMTAGLEEDMELVAKGKKTRESVLKVSRKDLALIIKAMTNNSEKIRQEIRSAFENNFGPCPACKAGYMRMIVSKKTKKRFAGCSNYPNCTNGWPLPQKAKIRLLEEHCKFCGIRKILVEGRRAFEICPNINCPEKKQAEVLVKVS
jgi:DNA topoisomerase IA/intein-encoded DNA endonuclease-like protein/predicted transcriptional regulator